MHTKKKFRLFFERWPDVHISSGEAGLVDISLASEAARSFPGLPSGAPTLSLPEADAEPLLSAMEAQGLDVFAWG